MNGYRRAEMMEHEHFIPFRKAAIFQMCLEDGRLDAARQQEFGEFATILDAFFHYEYHARLESLKDSYAPFDPDRDTRMTSEERCAEHRAAAHEQFARTLREILEKANYRQVSREEIGEAMVRESLFKLQLHIDFDDFEEMLLFRRGEEMRIEEMTYFFGLRKRKIEVPTWLRVVLYVQFKDRAWFAAKHRKAEMFEPGSTILKLFRTVPRYDLEMLLPNTEVRMRMLDKVCVGVPAIVGGIVVLVTRLGAVLGLAAALALFYLGVSRERPVIDSARLVALGTGMTALAGFLFKQWSNYKNRTIRFMKLLTENLYFRNLDNNRGVLHALVDEAEEEEVKEAVLAYFFLLISENPLTSDQLDNAVESWFQDKWDEGLDFEVDDGLAKLVRLGLAEEKNGVFSVLPLPLAKQRLDYLWDNFFDYNHAMATTRVNTTRANREQPHVPLPEWHARQKLGTRLPSHGNRLPKHHGDAQGD